MGFVSLEDLTETSEEEFCERSQQNKNQPEEQPTQDQDTNSGCTRIKEPVPVYGKIAVDDAQILLHLTAQTGPILIDQTSKFNYSLMPKQHRPFLTK